MHRKLVLGAFLGLALASTTPALADAVLLKNGRRIEGRVLRETDREVTIQTHSGVLMSFERSKVDQVLREGQEAADPTPGLTAKKAEDASVMPEGLTDDEADRLRKDEAQVRDVGRRLTDARQEEIDAEKDSSSNGQQQAHLAQARCDEFTAELGKLKIIRDGILRSAQLRREQAEKRAVTEAQSLRLDTDALRPTGTSVALAERAGKLKNRVPQDPRDPTHRIYLAEAVHAIVVAGEMDLDQAIAQATPELKLPPLRAAAERFALAASWAEGDDAAPLRDRAIQALTDAHRLAGLRPVEIEKALVALHGFRACATLVEDRLGERRWGAELLATEAGQYRAELADARVTYGDDLPTVPDARSVRERRERTERRVAKDDSGPSVTLVKVTRWYDLVWDPAKKKWARESALTQLETSQLAPLLRVMQEKEDALTAALAQRDKATKALATKRAATLQVRWQVDAADVSSDVLEKILVEQRAAEKAVTTADEAVTAARTAAEERASEAASLERDLERARKGGG